MRDAALLVVEHEGAVSQRVMACVERVLRDGSAHTLRVLMFCDDPNGHLLSRVRTVWQGDVVVLDAADMMRSSSAACRERVVDFVESLRVGFLEQMTHTSRSSSRARYERDWCYGEIAEKNSPGSPVWWRILHALLVQDTMREHPVERLLFVGRRDVAAVLRDVARERETAYSVCTTMRGSTDVARALVRRTMSLWQYTFAALFARVLCGKNALPQGALLFYSWYPRVWIGTEPHERDRYLGDLVDRLKETSARPVWYVGRLFDRPDGVPCMTMLRRLLAARRACRRLSLIVLEAYVSWSVLMQSWLAIGDALRAIRVLTRSSARALFVYQGVSYRSLLLPRMIRSWFVHVPHGRVLEASAEALARHCQPHTVTVYCFEYMYGRALMAGTRTAGISTRVIGLQHGPISPMKWLYAGLERGVPAQMVPDEYRVDGAYAKRQLVADGIEDERVVVCGAARLEDVWRRARETHPRARRTSGVRQILVAPGLHDTEMVLTMAFLALAGMSDVTLVIKPHPKVSLAYVSGVVERLATPRTSCSYRIVMDGDLYGLMDSSDLFVSSYSSAGVEAIAFGIPVVFLRATTTPDMSVFFGDDDVLMVDAPPALRSVTERLLHDTAYRDAYLHTLAKRLDDRYANVQDGSALETLASFYV